MIEAHIVPNKILAKFLFTNLRERIKLSFIVVFSKTSTTGANNRLVHTKITKIIAIIKLREIRNPFTTGGNTLETIAAKNSSAKKVKISNIKIINDSANNL
ncbi:MAG: hypothetical protein ACO3IH_04835, partial [Candidatus Nanopelagicales bacterium]